MPRISIVYVAYQTPIALLNRSIESVVRAADFAASEYEILVANNGQLSSSSLRHHRNLKVVGDGTNVGFGQAVNRAISIARGTEVLLMNPDSVIELEGIAELQSAQSLLQAPAVFGALLLNNGTPQVHAYNVWWSSTELILRKGSWKRNIDKWIVGQEPIQVSRLCGAGLFGLKSQLVPLGPFDDEFFLYGEDVDFSLRAQKAGLATVLVPKAVIHHDAGSSSGEPSPLVERARTDAYFRYTTRHANRIVTYAGRLESILVTLLGSLKPGQTPTSRRNRVSRLREIKRWGLRRVVVRFDPTRH